MKFLSGNYLFQTPSGTPSVYFGVLTAVFVVIFLASAFVYWRRGKLARENPVLRRFLRRMSKVGMWMSAIALFFALMRYVEFPYLSMPFLLDLVVLGMVLCVGYFVYDRSERYPLAVWNMRQSHLERRFRPAARPRAVQQPARPNRPRGKQRRR